MSNNELIAPDSGDLRLSNWIDNEFLSRTENVVEQAANRECSSTGAAELIMEFARDWHDKLKANFWSEVSQQ